MDEPKIDAMILENHPQDSRVKIKEDGIFQALAAQMGLGGECAVSIDKEKN